MSNCCNENSAMQVNENHNDMQKQNTQTTKTQATVYHPRADVSEQSGGYTIVADMPGLTPESIEINFEDGLLTIRGEVKARWPENARPLLQEYGVGNFERSFGVGDQVDASGITAEYRDGVLKLHLPKLAAAMPRKIAVQTA